VYAAACADFLAYSTAYAGKTCLGCRASFVEPAITV